MLQHNENEWHDVPNLGGMYQVTRDGDVRSLRHNRITIMHPRMQKKSGFVTVQVVRPDGGKQHIQVSRLVMDTFIGEKPDGMRRYHKNGNPLDNRLCNLTYCSQSVIGKRDGGKAKRKPVAKVKYTGEIVETYPSASEAARRNGYEKKVVIRRCNHTVRDALDNHGFTFMWMEELFSLKGDCMEW